MTPRPPGSRTDQMSGDYLRANLVANRNGVYAGMVTEDQTRVWDADQARLQVDMNTRARELNGPVDPVSINGNDDLEHLTLEQIRDLVYSIKPDVTQAVAEGWKKIGTNLNQLAVTLSNDLVTTIGESWEGPAAGRAAAGIMGFVNNTVDLASAAMLVRLKFKFGKRGVDETMRMISPVLSQVFPFTGPSPIPGVTHSEAPQIPVPGVTMGESSRKEEVRAACVQILQNVYAPAVRGADEAVPVLPSVNAVTTDNPYTPPNGLNPPGSAIPKPVPALGENQPLNNGRPAAQQVPGAPGGNDNGSIPRPDSASTGRPSDENGDFSSTIAASAAGAGLNPVPGGGFGGGSLGGGVGANPLANPTLGAAPVAGGMPPGATRFGAVDAAGGIGPGMIPPGTRGKGDDNREHKTADYLRGNHLEEWFDVETDARVMPAFGVVGGWAEKPANQPRPKSEGRDEHR